MGTLPKLCTQPALLFKQSVSGLPSSLSQLHYVTHQHLEIPPITDTQWPYGARTQIGNFHSPSCPHYDIYSLTLNILAVFMKLCFLPHQVNSLETTTLCTKPSPPSIFSPVSLDMLFTLVKSTFNSPSFYCTSKSLETLPLGEDRIPFTVSHRHSKSCFLS